MMVKLSKFEQYLSNLKENCEKNDEKNDEQRLKLYKDMLSQDQQKLGGVSTENIDKMLGY